MASKLLPALFLTVCLPVAAAAQDARSWAGPYVGLQYAIGNGAQSYGAGSDYDLEGTGVGLYGGYLWAHGAWAFGAELAYARTDYVEVDPATGESFSDYVFTYTVDLKARVGYAVGPALIYGVLGYGHSEYEDGAPEDLFHINAPIYGLGVDYMVSDRFVVGLEVLRRDLDADSRFTADLTTVTLRAALRF
ncbi:porin family protein [Roseicyclus persicicus]|uniref:Porin family protein n=1 Tax=Roseicyclus persicicus TaxID=2650661 RepID=A0A7X6H1M0_9RHOB|nr:porin family protein [Roseibacterium persicicum]NKX46371.1 porin family protein [Roseibacterium persicicum]